MACVSAGYVALAFATNLWQVAAIYGLCFSAGALICTLAGNTLVSNWFIVHRGRALGIAAAGVSAAGFIAPPLASGSLNLLGLRDTCLAVAVLMACSLPFIQWLTIDKPEDIGLLPDNMRSSAAIEEEAGDSDGASSLRALLGTSLFWKVAAPLAIVMAISVVMVINLVPIAQELGIARQSASYLSSVAAAFALAGMLVCGRLFDALSQRTAVLLTVFALSIACLMFIGRPTYPIMIAASVVLGLGFGAATLLVPLLPAKNFGRKAFTLAFGAITPVIVVLQVVGFPFFGRIHDIHGSYDLALQISVVVLAIAALIGCLLPGSRRSRTAL